MIDKEAPVCLVTGASSGIGRVIAVEMAKAGFRVVVTGRDPERTAETARLAGGAESVVADLADLAEVRELADHMTRNHTRLDVLVNNAAMIRSGRAVSRDGYELTWAVNYLAPFLLTNRLLDLLKAGAPARIVNVTSAVQGFGKLDFDDLQFERRDYAPMGAYAQSKLALVMFSFELAKRLEGAGVTANAIHPGGARTSLGRDIDPSDLGLLSKLIDPLIKVLTPATERTAKAPLYLATGPTGVTGEYFGGYLYNPLPPRPGRANRLAKDLAARERLWNLSLKMTGLG